MNVFNTTAVCIPEKHYMVYLSERVKEIKITTDYMLSFNFNKDKKPGVKQVHVGDRLLYEAAV